MPVIPEPPRQVNNILWLTMRRMRTPLILMILVYSFSVVGMVIIPGIDAEGEPFHMSFLDASYFVAIMATTIGFGETPLTFTDAQRLYVYIILFPNVTAWLYSIGTIIALFVDPQFRDVLSRNRFSRRVRKMHDGFYIVCGFGNTGRMIVRGLLNRGIGAAVLEREEHIIHDMALDPDFSHIPSLSGDVTHRDMLVMAGLHHPKCLGVVAITNEDHANLTIAITVKLLHEDLPVLARAETRRVVANMASFGTDVTVDPYTIFAERFQLALHSPTKYLVQDWLISVPGTRLREPLHPPGGRWILAGVGRFGSRMARVLEESDIPYTVIDVHPDRVDGVPGAVLGRGTEASTLEEAGISEAVGIIAGTGDDVDNLSIVMTALELNPKLFVVARQEIPQNDKLFSASGAHLVARRSLIVARRILAISTTPLLPVFLDYLVREDEEFARHLEHKLEHVLEGRAPSLWTVELKGRWAQSLKEAKRERVRLRLDHILHNTRIPDDDPLPCLCLLIERGGSRIFIPSPQEQLMHGDRLLFAGRGRARIEMLFSLTEPTALLSYALGKHQPRGALMRRLTRSRR